MCVYSEFLVLYFSEILVCVMLSLWNMPVPAALKNENIPFANNRDSIQCCYICGSEANEGTQSDHQAHKTTVEATGFLCLLCGQLRKWENTCW
jgi:hypothetical protein